MLRFHVLRFLAFGAIAVGVALPAAAQDDRERSTGYTAILDNIDLLVDNYAGFLARKYDLTTEQDEYTKSLLRERAYEFLDKHEDQLRHAVDRLFDVRTGGDMTQEELVQWGQEVKPIYEDAKKLIIDGNNDWREILTPSQQKIHDRDVKLMYESFETTEDQLGRILSGEMTVDEFRSPKRGRSSRARDRKPPPPRQEQPAYVKDEPPAPPPPPPKDPDHPGVSPAQPREAGRAGANVVRQPGEGQPPRVSERPPSRSVRRATERETRRGRQTPPRITGKSGEKSPESQWEKYVREFIEKYQLNDEQSQKANGILEDCQAQADRYLKGRKSQLEQYDQQIEALKSSKDKEKSKKMSELTEQRKKLTEPVDQIFEKQLKPRLERLPTRAQRRAAEEAAKKKPGSRTKSRKSAEKDSSDKSGE